ncbi:MAG: hypothetical protein V1646_05105 [bacterium]
MKVGIIFLFLLFQYANPMVKLGEHIFGAKHHESVQDVLKRFGDILQIQNPALVKKIRIFINSIGSNKNLMRECFSINLRGESVLHIFSRYADNVDDFKWIVKKMKWCGGNIFVWQQMSILDSFHLSFFHLLSVTKNFECVEFMFNKICKYAPTPRELRNFLLLKNESNECILTCISYSSALYTNEKILFLRLFVNTIRDIAIKIYSKDAGPKAELILLTELNESLLFEVIHNALVVHGKFVDWLPPFVNELVNFVGTCGGPDAVKYFVNKVNVSTDLGSLTGLDLLLRQHDMQISQSIIDDLIGFLRSVGAMTYKELSGEDPSALV